MFPQALFEDLARRLDQLGATYNRQSFALRRPFKPPKKTSIKGSTRYVLTSWAERIMNRDEGWPHRVAVLSGHKATEADYLTRSRTRSQIAWMWMDYSAEQEGAWDQL